MSVSERAPPLPKVHSLKDFPPSQAWDACSLPLLPPSLTPQLRVVVVMVILPEPDSSILLEAGNSPFLRFVASWPATPNVSGRL